MREHKYRAWDKEEKRMIYYESLTCCEYYKELCAQRVNDGNKLWIDDHFSGGDDLILMEYTGITDVNGTEIFEGDIVDFFDGDKNDFSKVFFEFGSFCIILNDEDAFPLIAVSKISVIGNIYDDREFLEEQNNA